MQVSVIIPSYKSPPGLEKLLRSLANQKIAHFMIQVVCVNNVPKHYKKEIIKKWSPFFHDFKYINSDFIGTNHARNIGISHATGNILWFLDDDCSLPDDSDFVSELIYNHNLNRDVIGLGGHYLNDGELKGFSKFYYDIAQAWFNSVIGENSYSTSLLGGNASYKRIIFDQGFRFNSKIIYGGTETGFNYNLIKAGHKLKVMDDLSIYHHTQVNFFQFLTKAYRQGMGKHLNGFSFRENNNLKLNHGLKFMLYSLLFKCGYFSQLTLKEKFMFFLREFYIIKSIQFLLRIPQMVFYALREIWWVIRNILYFIRNTSVKPFVKVYFVAKYHYQTYALPFLRKFKLLSKRL